VLGINPGVRLEQVQSLDQNRFKQIWEEGNRIGLSFKLLETGARQRLDKCQTEVRCQSRVWTEYRKKLRREVREVREAEQRECNEQKICR